MAHSLVKFIKRVIAGGGFLIFLACENSDRSGPDETLPDNTELLAIYNTHWADRKNAAHANWDSIVMRDQIRRDRISALLDSGKLATAKDYFLAARVFGTGIDSTSYLKAIELMKQCIARDSTYSKSFLASYTDNYLLSIGKPQIFGMVIQKYGEGPYYLAEIDTTKISEKQRIEYGVPTLAQRRKDIDRKNGKSER